MDIDTAASLFKILGDRSRLLMVAMMSRHECCVCDFTECFNMSQPAVSQHMRKLRELGLVRERKEGYWTYLSLDEESPFHDAIPELLAVIPEIDDEASALLGSCSRGKCC